MRDHSLGLRLGIAAAGSLLLLVPFALISVLIVGDWAPLHDFDRSVTDSVHDVALRHPGEVRAMRVWSLVFDPNSWRAGALVLAVWLARRGAKPLAMWVVLTMTAGGLLGLVLKLLVGRHRPELLDPVARAAGYSFPSGHALNNALGASVFMLVLLPFVRHRPRLRRVMWMVAAGVPVLTALSRVGLGVHWTSDVVAGLLVGVAVPAATAAAYETWRHRSGRPAVHVGQDGVEPDIAPEA